METFEFFRMVDQGDVVRCRELFKQGGIDLEATDGYGRSHLERACIHDDEDMVTCLLDLGANVHARNAQYDTPLHVAAQCSGPKVCQVLLDRGADINASCEDGSTPLSIAVQEGCLDVIRFLIERGANVQLPANIIFKTTILHLAAKSYTLTKLFLSMDQVASMVNVANDRGSTPLHVVVTNGYLETCELLIEHGADVNVRDQLGRTPLFRILETDRTDPTESYELARLLLSKGADPHVRDVGGDTVLHHLVVGHYCPSRLLKLLLAATNQRIANEEGLFVDQLCAEPLHQRYVLKRWQELQ